jgi:hypothetical protein
MMPVLRRTWAPCGASDAAWAGRSHETIFGIGVALIVSPRRRHNTLALALHRQRKIRGPEVR